MGQVGLQTIAAIGSGGRSLMALAQQGYDQRAREEEYNRKLQLMQAQELYRQANQAREESPAMFEHKLRQEIIRGQTLKQLGLGPQANDELEAGRLALGRDQLAFQREKETADLAREARTREDTQQLRKDQQEAREEDMVQDILQRREKGAPWEQLALAFPKGSFGHKTVSKFQAAEGISSAKGEAVEGRRLYPGQTSPEPMFEGKRRGKVYDPKTGRTKPEAGSKSLGKLQSAYQQSDQDLTDLIQETAERGDDPKKLVAWVRENFEKLARAGADPEIIQSALGRIKARHRKGETLDAILRDESEYAAAAERTIQSLLEETPPRAGRLPPDWSRAHLGGARYK